MTSPSSIIDRSCGPSGCQLDWLSSQRHEVDLDVAEFTAYANKEGWGDGLPLIPPTEERVRAFLAAADTRFPDELVATLPPIQGECTVEKIAINATMAGAPPESLPLLIAAIEAMVEPQFDLAGLNATTGSVVPALLVNGPIRHGLEIPFEAGCLGGVAGPAVAIGRAIRLLMRNVAGQQIGVTSKSVYGTPGRVAGIVFGEWEEKSPWASLAERRGTPGNAVTAYGAMGTMNMCDLIATDGPTFLEMIGKSLAVPTANGYLISSAFSEVMVLINPVWAEVIARDIPSIEDVEAMIWKFARLPIDYFPEQYRGPIEAAGRINEDGMVPLVPSPKDVMLAVAGGQGGLHGTAIHSWGATTTTTKAIAS